MAIVNRTPDSFFDKGATYDLAAALDRVDQVVEEGAAIVDVGGVKAGPGDEVDTAEEIRRTASFVAAIKARHPDVVVSVDTWRAEVGAACCQEGADLLNDVWEAYDPHLAEVAATYGTGLVCTHAGHAKPRTRPHRVAYDDVVADVVATCDRLVRTAIAQGVREDGIVVDPGHDFGKNSRHSLAVTRDLPALVGLGRPVLVALSNKDFVGETLDLPVGERLEGTLATTAISAWLGARLFRAHQVEETVRVLRMVSAIRGDTDVAVARRGLA
jgi:dihydropteroate synthase